MGVVLVLSLVFIGNVCFAEGAENIDQSKKNNRIEKKFEDWSLFVEEVSMNVPSEKEQKTEVKKVKIHYISNVVSTKEGQIIVKTDLAYVDAKKNKMVLAHTIPFGVDVQSDIVLRSSSKDLLSSKVVSCYRDGCKVGLELSLDSLEKISKAKDLSLAFKAVGAEKYQEIKISTKGLKKALDAMKKDASN
jgi:invasion protein IalB